MRGPLRTEDLPDTVYATMRGRLVSVTLVAGATGLALLFWLVALPLLETTLRSSPPAPNALRLARAVLIGFAGVGLLASLALITHACKILRHGQYPAPGAWVWRDTKIVRGRPAIRYARTCIVVATITGIACLGLAAYIWMALDRLALGIQLPEGVTLVRQKILLSR
ncbi:MAG TPA: hypothetical protein VHK70_09630 [Burkholderiaceae bacterium]|jgi:hypothetical protein|nr:hypothetical protein [Burkholderiaceae bacterium]